MSKIKQNPFAWSVESKVKTKLISTKSNFLNAIISVNEKHKHKHFIANKSNNLLK